MHFPRAKIAVLRHPLPSDLLRIDGRKQTASSASAGESGRISASPVTGSKPAHDDKNSCYAGRLVRTFVAPVTFAFGKRIRHCVRRDQGAAWPDYLNPRGKPWDSQT